MPSQNVADGRKTSTTPGTAVQIVASGTIATSSDSVMVQALLTNTNPVTVGASTTLAASGSRRGAILSAGQAVVLDVDDPSVLWLDVATSGDGVSYLFTF